MIPVKCSKKDYSYLLSLNKLSAICWNKCVEIDRIHHEKTGKYLNQSEMQNQIKGCVPIHSKGIYHVYRKYLNARKSMFLSIKAKHENSEKVKLPYKHKKYFNTGWDYQSIKVDYNRGIIFLARPNDKERHKRRSPVICYGKTIPQNIVEIELIYRNKLALAIKYKIEDGCKIKRKNIAAIDFGEIHSITSIDNNGNAIIITGRKLRSIKRLQNKEQSKLRSKREAFKKGSRKYKKYSRAIYKLKIKTDKQIMDCIHKISKMYLDYCLENDIGKVYCGDLDSCTRNTFGKINRITGQKINDWCHGKLTQQLKNKLSRNGIELIKIQEYYSTQTCPSCKNRHKTFGRTYLCECGYKQHRDIVGAINLLNFNEKTHIKYYKSKKYLRIT